MALLVRTMFSSAAGEANTIVASISAMALAKFGASRVAGALTSISGTTEVMPSIGP